MEISKEDKERIKAFATECWEEGTWSGYGSIELFYVGAEYEHRHLSQQLKEKEEQIKALREVLFEVQRWMKQIDNLLTEQKCQ